MAKPWRLTLQAEGSLRDIAAWTVENFGSRQADSYEDDLIAQCEAVASGTAHTQSCRSVIDPTLPDELRFTRVGLHLVVFVDLGAQIVIVDFFMGSATCPGGLQKSCGDTTDRHN